MSDDTGKSILGLTFILAIALVIWDELKNNHRVPVPKRFVGATLIWGTLGLVGPLITYPLAAVLALGFLVALYYQHWKIGPSQDNGSANHPGGTWNPGEPPGIQPPQTAPL